MASFAPSTNAQVGGNDRHLIERSLSLLRAPLR